MQFLFVLCMLVGGLALLPLAAGSAHRTSLACRREPSAVLCEVRKTYVGSIVTTDHVRLDSVMVDTRSYVLRSGTESYQILVLNSDFDVPGDGDPHVLAARLRELLDGKTTEVSAIRLREPSYGVAILLFAFGAFLSGVAALILCLQLGDMKRGESARLR
jgi:hypothetical protein